MEEFATHDFIEYWSAFQLFASGQNPYNPEQLLAIQKDLGWSSPQPLMMWNPPWLLIIMSPILLLEFHQAAQLWMYSNIGFIFLSGYLIAKAQDEKSKYIAFGVLGAFLCFPAWIALELGQISILLTLASSCLYYGLVKEKNSLIALAFCLFSVKPHLFYLIIIICSAHLIARKNFLPFLYTTITLAALIALTKVISHTSVIDWLNALNSTEHPLIIPTDKWRTSTLTSVISEYLLDKGKIESKFQFCAIVAISFAVFALYNYRKNLRAIPWRQSYPVILCFSMLSAPFGWFFDQASLNIINIAVFLAAFQSKKKEKYPKVILILLILLQLITALSYATIINDYSQFFWFPLACLIIWYIHLDKQKKLIQN